MTMAKLVLLMCFVNNWFGMTSYPVAKFIDEESCQQARPIWEERQAQPGMSYACISGTAK